MKYESNYRRRNSLRYPGYDYSSEGAYFITIDCKNMIDRFGKIVPAENDCIYFGQMELNDFGKIAFEEWQALPDRFPWLSLEEFQIMPNHMHGIVVLHDDFHLEIAKTINDSKISLLSQAIGAYKSLVYLGCLDLANAAGVILGKLWHRGFHDHIIRNEADYRRIANYIKRNPDKWRGVE